MLRPYNIVVGNGTNVGIVDIVVIVVTVVTVVTVGAKHLPL
jgi:hypothetical protein